VLISVKNGSIIELLLKVHFLNVYVFKKSTITLVYNKMLISVKSVNVAVNNESNYLKQCISTLQYVICDMKYM
jgi:hypothetical protein